MQAVEEQPTRTETVNRIEVVGEQHKIEKQVASAKKGAAVFVVPSLLTPLFISPDAVLFDGIHKLKEGSEQAIPDGLIPEEKMKDPKQLDTVLARVLTVMAMLKAGVNVVVLHVDEERKKADKKMGFVNKKRILELTEQFAKNLLLVPIADADYQNYKDKVCAATYYFDADKTYSIGIDATQINSAVTSQNWGVRTEAVAIAKIDNLNELLKRNNLASLQEFKDMPDLQATRSVVMKP